MAAAPSASGAAGLPQWIQSLEAHYRATSDVLGRKGKTTGLRKANRRRNPNAKGSTYGGITMSLYEWHVAARLDDLHTTGDPYIVFELLDPTQQAFKDFCEDHSTSFVDKSQSNTARSNCSW